MHVLCNGWNPLSTEKPETSTTNNLKIIMLIFLPLPMNSAMLWMCISHTVSHSHCQQTNHRHVISKLSCQIIFCPIITQSVSTEIFISFTVWISLCFASRHPLSTTSQFLSHPAQPPAKQSQCPDPTGAAAEPPLPQVSLTISVPGQAPVCRWMDLRWTCVYPDCGGVGALHQVPGQVGHRHPAWRRCLTTPPWFSSWRPPGISVAFLPGHPSVTCQRSRCSTLKTKAYQWQRNIMN